MTEMPPDNFNSIRGYELHVVMQNGDELQITGAMKKDDADFLAKLIARRMC